MAFRESTARLYVHLHPSCLENPAAALEHELNAKLLQYDEMLQGIVLAYDQVKVENPGGRVRIFNDSHFLNVYVSVRLMLFSPKPGVKLVGEVNFTNSSGIGLLVHGIFNASIQDAQIPESWEFVEEGDEAFWEAGDTKVDIGTLVSFEVLDCKNTDDILSIRASILNEEKYGVVGKAEVPFAERHKLDSSAAAGMVVANVKTGTPSKETNGENSGTTPTPKKRKKSAQHDEGSSDVPDSASKPTEGMNGEEPGSGKKKKAKGEKKKDVAGDEDEKPKEKKVKKEKKEKKEKKDKKKKDA